VDQDCLFCRIVEGAGPAAIVHSDDAVLACEDVNPQAPVHVLVLPRRHVVSARELADPPLLAAVLSAAHRVAEAKGVAATGYRLIFNVGEDAGQTVLHAHLHLLGGRPLGWPPG